MTDLEIEEVCQEDFREQLRMDAHEEYQLRSNIEYAYNVLDIESINIAIHKLITDMENLGYDLEYKDVLEYLEEL